MIKDEDWPSPESWHGVTTRQRDFGAQLTRLAGIYSSPILLSVVSDDSVVYNASGFTVAIGGKTFLVTNSHVMQSYRELLSAQTDAEFTFGGVTFAPNIVSEIADDDIDLAVIDVSGMTFEQRAPGYWNNSVSTFQKYTPPTWPLGPPQKGESTLTVGWPGKYRTQLGKRHLEFAAFPLLGQFVDDVKDTWFSIPFNRDQWVSSDWDPKNPVIFETTLGGISGSPVFALHRPGIHPLQLIGVVRSYGEGLDILYCSRADLIFADGSIRPQPGAAGAS